MAVRYPVIPELYIVSALQRLLEKKAKKMRTAKQNYSVRLRHSRSGFFDTTSAQCALFIRLTSY